MTALTQKSRSLSVKQLSVYHSHGFDVIHDHNVNVNPLGEAVEVDFSATDPDFIVRMAVKRAYEAGHRAGEVAIQAKLRAILGVRKDDSNE